MTRLFSQGRIVDVKRTTGRSVGHLDRESDLDSSRMSSLSPRVLVSTWKLNHAEGASHFASASTRPIEDKVPT